MTYFILFLIVAGIAATVHALVRDSRGPAAPPSSHTVDPTFLPPALQLSRR